MCQGIRSCMRAGWACTVRHPQLPRLIIYTFIGCSGKYEHHNAEIDVTHPKGRLEPGAEVRVPAQTGPLARAKRPPDHANGPVQSDGATGGSIVNLAGRMQDIMTKASADRRRGDPAPDLPYLLL